MKIPLPCFLLLVLLMVISLNSCGEGNTYTSSSGEDEISFKPIGPGAGGSMFGITTDPENPDLILFGGDMGAAYRSENGGRNWEIIGGTPGNQPGTGGVWQMKAAPGQRGEFWCVGGGTFKSIDFGKTWQCMPDIASFTLGAVAIDPNDPNRIFVAEGYPPRGILNWVNGNVWQSTDGGAKWTKLPRPGGSQSDDEFKHRTFSNLIVDSSRPYVYLTGRGGLFRWNGKVWNEIGKNIPGYQARQAADIRLSKHKGKQILFATLSPSAESDAGGVYRSDDGGTTWTALNNGLEELIERMKTSNKSLEAPHIFAFLLAYSPDKPERLYLASHHGLARSDDLGQHWKMLTKVGDDDQHSSYFYKLASNSHDYVSVVTGVNKFTKSQSGGMDHLNRMLASPSDGDIVFFSDNQDLYRSTDAGEHWESITFDYTDRFVDFDMHSNRSRSPITAKNRYEYRIQSRGVQNIVSDDLAVAPDNPDIIYAAYMDTGLQISRDGGMTWEHPVTTSQEKKISRDDFLPPHGHTWAVAVDPGNPGDVYVSHLNGGLYRSHDYGRNWRRIFNPEGIDWWTVGKINSIAVDIFSPTEKRTIYIATERKGVFKSSDGGSHWVQINSGISAGGNKKTLEATVIKIDPADHKRLYLGTAKGLFISTNTGENWTSSASGLFEKVENISINNRNSQRVYATAHLPGKNGYWGEASIWRSDDGGSEWRDITPEFMAHAGAIAVNPYDPDYLYACTHLTDPSKPEQKALIVRSRDGGETWEDIGKGVAFSRGKHINIDPGNPRRVFVHARFGIIKINDPEAPLK